MNSSKHASLISLTREQAAANKFDDIVIQGEKHYQKI
jgi:hypothetical protein